MNTPLNRQPQVVEAAMQPKKPGWRLNVRILRVRLPLYCPAKCSGRRNSESRTIVMAVVPARQMWVNANFKETQLRMYGLVNRSILSAIFMVKMFVSWSGDRDQYGNRQCVLLITAQNATGNWIKIVQRVPVEVLLIQKNSWNIPCALVYRWLHYWYQERRHCRDARSGFNRDAMPAYTSKALVIDTTPIEKELATLFRIMDNFNGNH